MRSNLLYLTLILILFSCQNNSNLDKLPRIERAYLEKEALILKVLSEKEIFPNQLQIFLRAFKQERIIEVWGKNSQNASFTKLMDYDFCAFSGQLGPKRREGDRQIPEGIYFIDRFNPKSKFHLSLGLNYPNDSDKILSDPDAPGSDIFIHGGCQSVGCIAITDEKIREVWVLAELSKKNGQSAIPVHVFPFKMKDNHLQSELKKYPDLKDFWKNLKLVFDDFEEEKKVNKFLIQKDGSYQKANSTQQ